ncbi:MAG: hypothetical protein PHQ90_06365 [Sulfuricurvum sp.]|uniref:hypothetical protein n=1 Tax=Sulfuricurvum sp. TaxID=2025608 RepID=UPI002611E2DF|nr:hypothetical protein [Sulfuricurvum sp.]MDD2368909.1 hypothetical protein [Sulfuricurvum sp.]MDD2950968.1 hypothetical protein [Sulfuricurvum sp.]MDD5117563.1 hypothetical protein [Sulfuricurvum sp.]
MLSKPAFNLLKLVVLSFILGGCTSITPHESLKNALNKTFDTTGYNYTSSTRITKIVFPKNETNTTSEEEQTATEKLSSLYVQKGISVLRGFSFGLNGAVDYADSIKSEATYDFHYNRDNVETSIKLPFLFDYSTKTLYMGKTFLNTIFPMKEEDEGKLIRLDLNDSFITTLISEESMKQFDEDKVRSLNSAMKEGTLKAFSDINGSYFKYTPLTSDEKLSGSIQKIHISLDRNQSIKLVLTITDAMIQKMYSESILSKEIYGSYMFLSDPKQLTHLMENVNVRFDFDFGINAKGRIALVESLINASDKEEKFALGIENITSLNNFNTPHFTLDPKSSGSIDYMEVFRSWKEFFPDKTPTDSLPEEEQISDYEQNLTI